MTYALRKKAVTMQLLGLAHLDSVIVNVLEHIHDLLAVIRVVHIDLSPVLGTVNPAHSIIFHRLDQL